jgi:hypothetical protein
MSRLPWWTPLAFVVAIVGALAYVLASGAQKEDLSQFRCKELGYGVWYRQGEEVLCTCPVSATSTKINIGAR